MENNLKGRFSVNRETGWIVLFGTKGIKKTSSQSKLTAICAQHLMRIVGQGKVVERDVPSSKKDQANIVTHKLETAVEIDGKPHVVLTRLREVNQGVFQYSLHAIKTDPPQISGSIAESNPRSAVGGSKALSTPAATKSINIRPTRNIAGLPRKMVLTC